MALPSGFSTTLSDPIGIRLVLLGLVVMPVAVLVLVFNVDKHEKINNEELQNNSLFQTKTILPMVIDRDPESIFTL